MDEELDVGWTHRSPRSRHLKHSSRPGGRSHLTLRSLHAAQFLCLAGLAAVAVLSGPVVVGVAVGGGAAREGPAGGHGALWSGM